MVNASIISSAAGMIPAAMMSEVAWLALSMVGKLARIVLTASAVGMSLTATWVTTANVPSEPTRHPVKS